MTQIQEEGEQKLESIVIKQEYSKTKSTRYDEEQELEIDETKAELRSDEVLQE